jgi:hypothetical protein
MQGTPFPFPGPSTVNKFLRRSAFSPNKEIFPMRPNNLTRCIFKTNVPNECRINNKANIYKHIHQKKKKNTHTFQGNESTMQKNAKMRMRILPADTPLKSGESWQKVLLETENSE